MRGEQSLNEEGKTFYKLTSKNLKAFTPDRIEKYESISVLYMKNRNGYELRMGVLDREVFDSVDSAISNIESRLDKARKDVENLEGILKVARTFFYRVRN